LKNEGGDLLGGELLAPDLDLDELLGASRDLVGDELLLARDLLVPAAHEALDGVDGVLGVGDLLVLGGLADESLLLLGEADDGGGDAVAAGVDEHLGGAALHDGDDGVGGSQVDADGLGHDCSPCVQSSGGLSEGREASRAPAGVSRGPRREAVAGGISGAPTPPGGSKSR